MGELGRLLGDRQRQGSVILPATVVSNRSDGNVNVRIRHTRRIVVASRASVGGAYTAGQVVQVSRTDASGVTINTGWVIIGPPPTNMRGSSRSVPLEESTTKTAATVIRIVPNPVFLDAGGDAATVTLYGVFAGIPALAYGSADLSDDVAPVLTPTTQITLQVCASESAANGEHDLSIDEVVAAPHLFHVTAAGDSEPPDPSDPPEHSLWALVYNDDYASQALVRIDASTMVVFHQYELGGVVGETYLTNKAGIIYAKCGTQFFKYDATAGETLDPVACANTNADELQLADVGSLLFYGDVLDGVNHLYLFDSATDTESGWALDMPIDAFWPTTSAVTVDGLHLWICGQGSVQLIRWEIASASIVGRFPDPVNAVAVAVDEDSLYLAVLGAIKKYTIEPPTGTTLTEIASTAISMSVWQKLKVVAGDLYSTNGTNLTRLDRATLGVISVTDCGHETLDFEFADGTFYVGDLDGGVTRVDASTMTIIDRTVVAANDAACLVYV